MRPSVQKSLLLAATLAVGASSIEGPRGGALTAQPGAERPRPALGGAAWADAPRLVLLPAATRGPGRPRPTPAAFAGPQARADFLARVRGSAGRWDAEGRAGR